LQSPIKILQKVGGVVASILIAVGFTVVNSAPNNQTQDNPSALPNRGIAPEFLNTAWLNSDIPLRLANLRGSVVLLEFWTFDCINCIRTLPYVERWYQTYRDQGLVVVGIHYPEFNYERDPQNVVAAAQRLGVTYPIGLDNDAATWSAYNQRFWPTLYAIDKRGHIRYMRIGEGAYDTTEQALQALLAETYTPDAEATATIAEPLPYLTPDSILNVRSAPGTDSAVIGSIAPGMSFVILDEQAGWFQIRYGDDLGFVSGDFVTISATES